MSIGEAPRSCCIPYPRLVQNINPHSVHWAASAASSLAQNFGLDGSAFGQQANVLRRMRKKVSAFSPLSTCSIPQKTYRNVACNRQGRENQQHRPPAPKVITTVPTINHVSGKKALPR